MFQKNRKKGIHSITVIDTEDVLAKVKESFTYLINIRLVELWIIEHFHNHSINEHTFNVVIICSIEPHDSNFQMAFFSFKLLFD